MNYTIEKSLQYFDAWSGGKDTLNTLKELCINTNDWQYIDTLEEFIEETFKSTKTETDINDFLWFEKNEIAIVLGFKNWEELERENKQIKDIHESACKMFSELYEGLD